MHKYIIFILSWVLLSAPVGAQVLLEGGSTTVDSSLSVTTGALDLYVTTTGDDDNECTSGAPCLTIQAALDRVCTIRPCMIRHPVTVNVGAGSFAKGAWLNGFIPDVPADSNIGSYLIISGTWGTPTLATGTTTGTLTGVSTGSGVTWSTVTDSTQTWTVGALRGLYIEFTNGPAVGRANVISDNTATTITLAGVPTGIAPVIGNTYAIRSLATTITGTQPMAPTPMTIAAATTLAAASFLVDGISMAPGAAGDGRVLIQRFAFDTNVTRAFGVYADVGLSIRQCTFNQSIANARAVVLNKAGSIVLRDNRVNHNSTGGFIEQQQGGVARVIDMQNNVINGGGNTSITANVSFFRSTGNSIIGAGRGHHFGMIHDGQINSDKWSGITGECIYGNAASADGTTGQITIVNVSFGTCPNGVIAINGPIYMSFQDTSGSTGSSIGYGIIASEGSIVRLHSTTNITGTLGDLVVDDELSRTSLARLRAFTPKRIQSTLGSKIFER